MTKPHDFKKQTKMLKTSDDWHPNCQDDTVRVSLIYLNNGRPEPGNEPQWRVCVWGDDDDGMEFDQPSRMAALDLYKSLDKLQPITKAKLKTLGFIRA